MNGGGYNHQRRQNDILFHVKPLNYCYPCSPLVRIASAGRFDAQSVPFFEFEPRFAGDARFFCRRG